MARSDGASDPPELIALHYTDCKSEGNMSDDEQMEAVGDAGGANEEEQAAAGSSKGGAGAGKGRTGKRFEIKKWSAVAMWSWAICTDTCAICRYACGDRLGFLQLSTGTRGKAGR